MKVMIVGTDEMAYAIERRILHASTCISTASVIVVECPENSELCAPSIAITALPEFKEEKYFKRRKSDDQPWKKPWKR